MSKSNEVIRMKQRLQLTDLSMSRIIEDLIRILVQRGYMKYSDLSDQSREKLREREELRGELRMLMHQRRNESGIADVEHTGSYDSGRRDGQQGGEKYQA
jgi:hypothetical protein